MLEDFKKERTKMTLDHTITNCIVKAHNFGDTVVHNVCAGTSKIIPWGHLDYIGPLGWVVFIVAATVFLTRIALVAIDCKVEKVKK